MIVKMLLIAFSLSVGTAAVIKTVELMHAATAVMDQALEGSQR
jgi:hypothetical protein